MPQEDPLRQTQMDAFVTRTKRPIEVVEASKKKQRIKEEEEVKEEIATSSETQTYSKHWTYPIDILNPSFRIEDGLSSQEGSNIRKHGDLDLLYFSPFLKKDYAQQLYLHLLNNMPWYRVTYTVGARTIRTPRWTTVFGLDDTAEFEPPEEDGTVAGRGVRPKKGGKLPAKTYKNDPRPLPLLLSQLKKLVEEKTGAEYNFCLLNLYLDGKDSISYHSDDEGFLGENPTIASMSLGSTRTFLFKQKEKDDGVAYAGNKNKNKKGKGVGKGPVEKFQLNSGDLIVMRSTTQRNWLHSIPKTTTTVGPRINITFRKAMNVKGTNNYYHFNVHAALKDSGENEAHRYSEGNMVKWKGVVDEE
ncbi:hypothetical protein PROFUN_00288 [Planoprotostelium fungivorum]|uniref:Fe2OG dioxygenase domain-containing protein n=1 Tax=Planoprotostelium fungivorum TaxID=1890364 RepID=A0A2P6NXZ7_9EUKA|nr:hypothetical protein PROFUN_00288 [Planoprotostelium fungivorum]